MARGTRTLRRGALLMSSCMNGFYGLKRLRGNEPLDIRPRDTDAIREVEALSVDRRTPNQKDSAPVEPAAAVPALVGP